MHQQQRNNKETNVNFWQPPRLFTAATPPPPQQTLRSVYDYGELQQLGCGAYAQVYKGIDLLPGSDKMTPAYREVALKRINLASLADKEVYKVTVNEVQLFQTLNHRNIVQCYYHFDEISPYTNNHYLVLVLEYVNGGDLQNWLKNRTLPYQMLVSERDIWFIFAQIAEAVAYTHSKQIMHRDLKPENVLLTIDWCVKLADFGLSRLLQVVQVAQTVCGTPYYMSPERIAECPYTFKSDIWSMGCILYEMATLKSPFYGEKDNITSLVEKIRRAQFPPVQDDCYTGQLEMLIQTCLALDPEKRPTSGEVSRVSRVMNERWQAYNDTNVYTISADGLVPTASSSEPSSSSFTGCVESVDKLKAEETKRWGSH